MQQSEKANVNKAHSNLSVELKNSESEDSKQFSIKKKNQYDTSDEERESSDTSESILTDNDSSCESDSSSTLKADASGSASVVNDEEKCKELRREISQYISDSDSDRASNLESLDSYSNSSEEEPEKRREDIQKKARELMGITDFRRKSIISNNNLQNVEKQKNLINLLQDYVFSEYVLGKKGFDDVEKNLSDQKKEEEIKCHDQTDQMCAPEEFEKFSQLSNTQDQILQNLEEKIKNTLQFEFNKHFTSLSLLGEFKKTPTTKEKITDAALQLGTDLCPIPGVGAAVNAAKSAADCYSEYRERSKSKKELDNLDAASAEEFSILSELLASIFIQITPDTKINKINSKRDELSRKIVKKFKQFAETCDIEKIDLEKLFKEIGDAKSQSKAIINIEDVKEEGCRNRIAFGIVFFADLKDKAEQKKNKLFANDVHEVFKSFDFEKVNLSELEKVKPVKEIVDTLESQITECKRIVEHQPQIDMSQNKRIEDLEKKNRIDRYSIGYNNSEIKETRSQIIGIASKVVRLEEIQVEQVSHINEISLSLKDLKKEQAKQAKKADEQSKIISDNLDTLKNMVSSIHTLQSNSNPLQTHLTDVSLNAKTPDQTAHHL